MKKHDQPIIVEQSFNAPIERVWNAITDVAQMRQWYFDNIPAFKPEVGFETQFDVQTEQRIFRHIWKVTEVVPQKLISYTWKYEGYPGDSQVMFELFKGNQSTKLRLTHQIKESFPQDIPEFSRESGIEGWKYFIQNSLKEFLDKSA
ncbi:MAG: SRPBCC domain-containing protein [Aliifodinibius sp.]|nr:SRPBCC domain-containing protein [Fodinibius sp.]NIV10291.1 SRPBCC domain-containing protein [Fodinibius sp.]NIY23930.1 SRPBCC domain-containing protein [Fodinibius sp.]